MVFSSVRLPRYNKCCAHSTVRIIVYFVLQLVHTIYRHVQHSFNTPQSFFNHFFITQTYTFLPHCTRRLFATVSMLCGSTGTTQNRRLFQSQSNHTFSMAMQAERFPPKIPFCLALWYLIINDFTIIFAVFLQSLSCVQPLQHWTVDYVCRTVVNHSLLRYKRKLFSEKLDRLYKY